MVQFVMVVKILNYKLITEEKMKIVIKQFTVNMIPFVLEDQKIMDV